MSNMNDKCLRRKQLYTKLDFHSLCIILAYASTMFDVYTFKTAWSKIHFRLVQ